MAVLFQEPSCMHWWLPNDESYPPIIRALRRFVEERTSEARDVPAEDLRDMKAIFSLLKLDDGTPARKAAPAVAVAGDQEWLDRGIGAHDSRSSEGLGDDSGRQYGTGYEGHGSEHY
jgi:hypothetical protein